MVEFYPPIKFVHIAAVIISGSLFGLRGLLMLAGSGLSRHVLLRYLSYAIDTTLLTAALMLTTIIQQYPGAQSWLTVKVLCLVAYIVLGTFALKRGRSYGVRLACFVAAITVFLFIVSVARAHSPWGWFA